MDERLKFIARLLDGEKMAVLCRQFGISRKTGYKILTRYNEIGLEGLTDRSRRPYRHANQLPFQIETQIVRLKQDKPSWGAPKIREKLARLYPDVHTPAISTVHAVLDRSPDLRPAAMIALPWTAPSFAAMKGVIHEPSTTPTMKPESRDALLTAIGKARGWIDDIRLGRIASFAGIAQREAVGETAHPPARSSRPPFASYHRSDRRWHGAGRSHGHRSRQSPALFLGRIRAVDLAKHLGSANPGRRRAFNESDSVLWQQQS
ncbi:MAG TPA: helix-turn-helix domain-containing protein [Gemmataceae bacterium]|nr:helix-turn-helix domain-containing protein [Gemmataceae bacterium]